MPNALPCLEPTNPVRLTLPSARRLAQRVDAVVARSGRAGVDRVGDCVLAMEAIAFTAPTILTMRNVARQMRVAVVLPGYDRLLTPSDARSVANALRADNAIAGGWMTAFRLDDAADKAERRDPTNGPLDPRGDGPRPNKTGARFLTVAIVIAATVILLRVFA